MASSLQNNSNRQLQLQLRRRQALADALAGVVATLVSLWTFYPIDVFKTKLQAGTHDHNDHSNANNNNYSKQQQWLQWKGLFRGLPMKTLHAASSSFTYFYLYSFIVSWWNARKQSNSNTSNEIMSTGVRLTLSAVAAMLNTFLTLPLDVLASQHQASQDQQEELTQEESSSSSTAYEDDKIMIADSEHDLYLEPSKMQQQQQMDQIWKQIDTPRSKKSPVLADDHDEGDVFFEARSEPRGFYDNNNDSNEDEDEKEAKEETEQQKEETHQNHHSPHYHPASNQKFIVTLSSFCQDQFVRLDSRVSVESDASYSQQPVATTTATIPSPWNKILSLWKGLYPSLLLCSNPSINYTLFDCTKNYMLQSRSNHLTMMEAFLLGLFAKFCATMATYPLIRAKVMLMVTSRNSMLMTLIEIYRHGGLSGWYKGCSVQLLHTVLKSALLMMVKERIAVTTHRLLVPQTAGITITSGGGSSAQDGQRK